MHHNEYFIIRPGIKKVFIGGQSTNEWRPAIETVLYFAVVQHHNLSGNVGTLVKHIFYMSHVL